MARRFNHKNSIKELINTHITPTTNQIKDNSRKKAKK